MKLTAQQKLLEILKDNKFHSSMELCRRLGINEYRKPIHNLKKLGYRIFQGTLKYPNQSYKKFGYILLTCDQISHKIIE